MKARILLLLALFLVAFNQLQAQRVRTSGSGGRLPTTGISVPSPTTSSHTANNTSANGAFSTDSASTDTSAAKGLIFVEEIPDSVLRAKVFLFHYVPHAVWTYRTWNPTLDPTGVQYNDPIDAFNGNYYIGKGALGQPHIGLFANTDPDLAIRIIPDAYPAYSFTPQNIYLFQTLTPYTRLSYGSSIDKDYSLRATHTRNVAPGFNVAIDYRLFNPEGVYTSSGTSNHYLVLSSNYFSPDSRLQVAAAIIRQALNIDENGGISDDSYFTQRRQSNRAGIPVVLSNSGTVERNIDAFLKASYSLQRQSVTYRHRDSIAFSTTSDSSAQSLSRPDTIIVIDTIPLTKPHVFNSGVVGLEINASRHKRLFIDSTLLQERSATLFWTNDAYPDYRWRNPFIVTFGVSPRVVNSTIYADTLKLQSFLDPFASFRIAVGSASLTLDADLRGAFNDIRPDSRLSAVLLVPFDSARTTTLSLSAIATSRTPDLRLLHDALIGQNIQLNPTTIRRYSLDFVHKELLHLHLAASRLNNTAYCDTLLFVHQADNPFWLLQASLSASFHLSFIHLDIQQQLQRSTGGDQMPVPLWTSKNSLYTDFLLFRRALRLQVGTDIRYHSPYYAPTYDPATGLFLHQSATLIGNYIWADLFLNLQVKRASIYLKAGHINALWDASPNYFLLPHYPGTRFAFLWGLTWQFFD